MIYMDLQSFAFFLGGERGIRTPGTVTRTPHFECGPIDHSGISPFSGRDQNLCFGTANIDIIFIFCPLEDEKNADC